MRRVHDISRSSSTRSLMMVGLLTTATTLIAAREAGRALSLKRCHSTIEQRQDCGSMMEESFNDVRLPQ